MSKKTIAKFPIFVILIVFVSLFFCACSLVMPQAEKKPRGTKYGSPGVRGKIDNPDITESSGLAASKCQPNVFWTHNDSGDDAFVYALDAKGADLGTWKVPNAENVDWEDIAAIKSADGRCYIYIGETGDNQRKRPEHIIYRIVEPAASELNKKSSQKNPQQTSDPEILKYSYPDGFHDAESLAVNPKNGDIYILSKRLSGPAEIYRLKPVFGQTTIKAEVIGEIAVPSIPNGLLTGADISPDGKSVIICDYSGGYELNLPENSKNFDEIWKQKPEPVDLGDRKAGEAVCYSADGSSIFATSEGKHPPIFEIKRVN